MKTANNSAKSTAAAKKSTVVAIDAPAKKRTKKAATKKAAAKKTAVAVERNFLDHGLHIVKTVEGNPRREGTHGHESFAKIKNGMTIEQFISKGGRLRDLHWDMSHKYVQLKKKA